MQKKARAIRAHLSSNPDQLPELLKIFVTQGQQDAQRYLQGKGVPVDLTQAIGIVIDNELIKLGDKVCNDHGIDAAMVVEWNDTDKDIEDKVHNMLATKRLTDVEMAAAVRAAENKLAGHGGE